MSRNIKNMLQNGVMLFVWSCFFYIVFQVVVVNKGFDHDVQTGVIQRYTDYDSIKSGYHSVGGGCYFDIENLEDKKIIYIKPYEFLPIERATFIYEINKDMSYSLKKDFITIIFTGIKI